MADLERKIADAREQLGRSWTDERVDRVAGALEGRRRRRTARRAALTTLAIVVAVGAGWRVLAPSRAMQLAPGAVARLVDGGELRTLPGVDGATVAELTRGAARIDVAHAADHPVWLRAGDVTVQVIGARVLVAHAGYQLRVSVEEGSVTVLAGGETRALAAGREASFPLHATPKSSVPAPVGSPEPSVAPTPAVPMPAVPTPAVPTPAVPTPAVPTPTVGVTAPKAAPVRAPRAWRTSAEQGDFDKAYEQLARSGPQAVRDVPAELLLAADVARLSHHAAEAVSPLERVVRDHRRDPRAPLAAFTLGRVLLDELGRPQQAAAAFGKARALASDGPLASDALAREVEAWSRAGDQPRARQRAEEYLQRYPKGARINSVRRFGGIE